MARFFCLNFFAVLVLSVPALADEAPAPATFPPERLGSGGYVVFFRHTERDKTPSQSVLWEMDRANSCESGGALNALLSDALPAGQNRFLIAHSGVLIEESIGRTIELEQGEAVVFRPVGKNDWPGFEFLGIIHLMDWGGEK